jgi:hypothetical protein
MLSGAPSLTNHYAQARSLHQDVLCIHVITLCHYQRLHHLACVTKYTMLCLVSAALQSQGPKRTMEDCNCLAALHPEHGVLSSTPSRGVRVSQQHVAVAAVFDGHAGVQTALTAAEHLPHLLHQGLTGRQGSSTASEGQCSSQVWQCS